MEQFTLRGKLVGHTGLVTALATSGANPNLLVSASRDRTLLVWTLTRTQEEYGRPLRSLHGHAHFVSDVALSQDGNFALSGSWDGTLRLWDLTTGVTARRFVGHTKDVLSVAFSSDNRQIVSASRDNTVRLWNTLGECKFVFEDGAHTEWVSAVRFSPNLQSLVVVSGGWDSLVKVWGLAKFALKTNLVGHTGPVYSVAVSPDGSLCSTGGKDSVALLWDLNKGRRLALLEAGAPVNALAFNPGRYWLCAATDNGVRIWDLGTRQPIADLTQDHPEFEARFKNPAATSVAWSHDGNTLFVGYSDNIIRVWECPAIAAQ